jgi:hypothetical protein
MSVDLPPDLRPKKKRQKTKTSELKVVFDANALYVTPNNIGSATDLVRPEIANIIAEARYPDLDIHWYLPEIVRHERQYQMQVEALKLRFPINRIERLLGHNLLLTDQILLDHVKAKLEEKEKELGLQEIKLDHSLVDWSKLILAAAYREPPFEVGEKEKGFKDALVAESFLQLLAASPRTPSVCRVILVTADKLLAEAVNERMADSPNASVLASVEELKGLINTIVSNVGEDFIAQIKPKAAKLFFISSEEKETVYYREKIRERLTGKFESELEARPQGTGFRLNGKWFIDQPNFSRKEGRRVFWTSRIEIEIEVGTVTNEGEPTVGISASSMMPQVGQSPQLVGTYQAMQDYLAHGTISANAYVSGFRGYEYPPVTVSEKRVTTHKGRDIFEVLWSTEVTMSKDLKKPIIEDITHVELNCQPIL